MHMNANEPVTESKVKLWISAEAYISIDPKWSQQEREDYVRKEAKRILKQEPTVNIENKQLEDVE